MTEKPAERGGDQGKPYFLRQGNGGQIRSGQVRTGTKEPARVEVQFVDRHDRHVVARAAKRETAEANEHMALAQAYRGTRIAQAAVHHDRLAGLSRDAAKEATTAAEMHKQLAGLAR